MSIAKGKEIVRGWPADRSAPRRLSELIKQAKGQERENLQRMVENLVIRSVTQTDRDLVSGYFGTR